jgi:hypothetical protein
VVASEVQMGSDEPPSNVNVESVETDLIPQSYMFAYSVQKHIAERPLFVLFDPGSKSSFINKRAIPIGATPQLTHNAGSTITAAGTFPNNLSVVLRDLVFPEFSSSLVVERHGFLVFDQLDVHYDVILGRDFLIPTEFDISYSNKTMFTFKQNDDMARTHGCAEASRHTNVLLERQIR